MSLLVINQDQLLPITHFEGDISALVDNKTDTKSHAGWNNISYPAIVLLDLECLHKFEKIEFFDGPGSQEIEITGKKTLSESEKEIVIFKGLTDKYNQWTTISVLDTFEYIFLKVITPKAEYCPEIKFFAEPIVAKPIKTVYINAPKPKGKKFFGANGFNWIPSEVHSFLPTYRSYHDIPWVAQTKDQLNFFDGGGVFKGDSLFKDYKEKGIDTILCLQGCPPWIKNAPNGTNAQHLQPIEWGKTIFNTEALLDYVEVVTQYVMRYGSKKVEDSRLKLMDSKYNVKQPRLSGLDLVKYYEVTNEPDGWWKEGDKPVPVRAKSIYTPFEQAALLSACWDGHEGRLPNLGIKNIDPDAKLVMGAQANPTWKRIKAMDLWFKHNRKDKMFCADILNFHMVANDGGQQFMGNKGISPESFKMKDRVNDYVVHVKSILPDLPIFLTEFAYDTNNSIQSPKDFPISEREIVQAGWLLRTYLHLWSTGVDRALIYNISDEPFATPTTDLLYQMSGIVTAFKDLGGGCLPKVASVVLKKFLNLIGEKVWTIEEDYSNNLYKLKSGDEELAFVWGGKSLPSKQGYDIVSFPLCEKSHLELPIVVKYEKQQSPIPDTTPEILDIIVTANSSETLSKDFAFELQELLVKHKVDYVKAFWKKF